MARRVDRTAAKLARLREVLAGAKTMLIVLQDDPDPDALAAGAALRVLANHLSGVMCSMGHGGMIGRAENRALARYLDLNFRPLAEIEPTTFGLIAMVDTQPATGNNSLPDGTPVSIIIDHHPTRRASRRAPFTDIRRSYGATSTILFEYLTAAKVEIDIPIATALVYGIRSDTQDLGREATKADIRAHTELYGRANPRMLAHITHAPLPHDYFRYLHLALENAKHCGAGIYTTLGEIGNTDMIGEVADLLLRSENAAYSLAWGTRQGVLHLSLRTGNPDVDAGRMMRHIVARKGTGGGHERMAGGQIPLAPARTATALKRLERTIIRRFMKRINEPETRCRTLISAS